MVFVSLKHLTDAALSITYTCSDGKSFDSAKNQLLAKLNSPGH